MSFIKYTFVFKEIVSVDVELSQKTRYPSVAKARSHTETFFNSSAPSYNFYPKVSIFDLQSNRRASTRVDLELCTIY